MESSSGSAWDGKSICVALSSGAAGRLAGRKFDQSPNQPGNNITLANHNRQVVMYRLIQTAWMAKSKIFAERVKQPEQDHLFRQVLSMLARRLQSKRRNLWNALIE
jgi:hypothetical protein